MTALLALADPPLRLRSERPADAAAIEAVVARAFGPGRYAKTAERLRERAALRPELSFTARAGGDLVGTVRLWSVAVGGEPAVFLGPIAVDRDRRSGGVGAALVRAALTAAEAAGERAVLLVGDPPYFAQFGFEEAAGVVLPGPVDPSRVLANVFRGGPLRGLVTGLRATTPAA